MQVLQVGYSRGVQTPSASRSSFGLWVFSGSWVATLLWGLWLGCVPAPPTCFDVGLLSFAQCLGVTQTAFSFFSEEVVPYVAADSVCQGRWWAQDPPSPSWTEPLKVRMLFPLELLINIPNIEKLSKEGLWPISASHCKIFLSPFFFSPAPL